jgi:hypothetical protein
METQQIGYPSRASPCESIRNGYRALRKLVVRIDSYGMYQVFMMDELRKTDDLDHRISLNDLYEMMKNWYRNCGGNIYPPKRELRSYLKNHVGEYNSIQNVLVGYHTRALPEYRHDIIEPTENDLIQVIKNMIEYFRNAPMYQRNISGEYLVPALESITACLDNSRVIKYWFALLLCSIALSIPNNVTYGQLLILIFERGINLLQGNSRLEIVTNARSNCQNRILSLPSSQNINLLPPLRTLGNFRIMDEAHNSLSTWVGNRQRTNRSFGGLRLGEMLFEEPEQIECNTIQDIIRQGATRPSAFLFGSGYGFYHPSFPIQAFGRTIRLSPHANMSTEPFVFLEEKNLNIKPNPPCEDLFLIILHYPKIFINFTILSTDTDMAYGEGATRQIYQHSMNDCIQKYLQITRGYFMDIKIDHLVFWDCEENIQTFVTCIGLCVASQCILPYHLEPLLLQKMACRPMGYEQQLFFLNFYSPDIYAEVIKPNFDIALTGYETVEEYIETGIFTNNKEPWKLKLYDLLAKEFDKQFGPLNKYDVIALDQLISGYYELRPSDVLKIMSVDDLFYGPMWTKFVESLSESQLKKLLLLCGNSLSLESAYCITIADEMQTDIKITTCCRQVSLNKNLFKSQEYLDGLKMYLDDVDSTIVDTLRFNIPLEEEAVREERRNLNGGIVHSNSANNLVNRYRSVNEVRDSAIRWNRSIATAVLNRRLVRFAEEIYGQSDLYFSRRMPELENTNSGRTFNQGRSYIGPIGYACSPEGRSALAEPPTTVDTLRFNVSLKEEEAVRRAYNDAMRITYANMAGPFLSMLQRNIVRLMEPLVADGESDSIISVYPNSIVPFCSMRRSGYTGMIGTDPYLFCRLDHRQLFPIPPISFGYLFQNERRNYLMYCLRLENLPHPQNPNPIERFILQLFSPFLSYHSYRSVGISTQLLSRLVLAI